MIMLNDLPIQELLRLYTVRALLGENRDVGVRKACDYKLVTRTIMNTLE